MALHRKHLIDEIVQGLSYLQTSVESLSSLNLNDLAVTSEDFFALLLNAIFDLDLKNLNRVSPNHPAIDLGDRSRGECFQVTADSGKAKIQETIDKFLQHGLNRQYSRIRFLVIGRRRKEYSDFDLSGLQAAAISFAPAHDILTIEKLSDRLQALTLEKLTAVHSIVVSEIRYPGPMHGPAIVARAHSSDDSSLDLRSYFAWMSESTASVVVPGLGVSLPTAESADRYLMEESLSPSDTSGERLESAIDLILRIRTLLVQGAAGAGKSTLLVQLANHLSRHNVFTVRLRLPLLLKRLEAIGSFDLALAESACDQSPLSAAQLRGLLSRPLHLLADGLDECGQSSTTIARAFADWSIAHPAARILVTTRGSSKDHPALSAWSMFRLQPLAPAASMLLANRILAAAPSLTEEDRGTASARLAKYRDQAGDRADWTHAPLAIGLLLALAVRGRELDCGRAVLLNQVFDLLRHSRREGRSREGVAASVMDVSIDALGWALQSSHGIGLTGAIAVVGRELETRPGINPIQASQEAEHALLRWEAAGLVERTGGCSPQLEFVHRQFQEFAAARALIRRTPLQIIEHVTAFGRQPGWQDTLIFASGLGATNCIVDALLAQDDPNSPLSFEGLTAARAELETKAADANRIARIGAALVHRMESPIPLVAYEAGDLAVTLAKETPSPFRGIGRALSVHPQRWTRAIGWTLLAVVGDLNVEGLGEALQQGLLDDFVCRRMLFGTPGSVSEASDLHTEFLRRSTVWLLGQSDERANQVLRKLFAIASFPVGLTVEYCEQLKSRGLGDVLDAQTLGVAKSLEFLPHLLSVTRAGEIAFLEAVLVGGEGSSPPNLAAVQTSTLPSLRRLATAIGLNQSAAASDLAAVGLEAGRPVLRLVVRAAIIAAGLNGTTLREEARVALTAALADEQGRGSFWSMGVGRSDELDWVRAIAELQPPLEQLALGLHHPSRVIAMCAAHLLAAGDPERGLRALANELMSYGEFGLYLAAHLCHDWGREAIGIFLDRCEALDSPIASALELLPQIETPPLRSMSILKKGLFASDPRVASSAARGLASLPLTAEDGVVICRALDDWSCRANPDVTAHVVRPSPRSDLVRAGVAAGALDSAELSCLLSDSRFDVRDAAGESLAKLAVFNQELAADLVARASKGELPAALLAAMEKEQGFVFRDDYLLQLLASSTGTVRGVGLQMIARRADLSDAVVHRAWALLGDEAPANRNLAAGVIRDRRGRITR